MDYMYCYYILDLIQLFLIFSLGVQSKDGIPRVTASIYILNADIFSPFSGIIFNHSSCIFPVVFINYIL